MLPNTARHHPRPPWLGALASTQERFEIDHARRVPMISRLVGVRSNRFIRRSTKRQIVYDNIKSPCPTRHRLSVFRTARWPQPTKAPTDSRSHRECSLATHESVLKITGEQHLEPCTGSCDLYSLLIHYMVLEPGTRE